MADSTAFPRKDLDHVFYPRSVAVLGTNRVVGTVPHDIFANILKDNFQGIVYPVSPKERWVAGVRAYKYVLDIPDPVDLAILVFPSTVCNLALEQCGQKGVKSAIIISAGFREIGPAGVKREEEIKEIARSTTSPSLDRIASASSTPIRSHASTHRSPAKCRSRDP